MENEETFIEYAVKYDGSLTSYPCVRLRHTDEELVLLHQVREPFCMRAGGEELCIPAGAYTVAFYWEDKPFNAYYWLDPRGVYLGTYFNLAEQTVISTDTVTFHDLIVDVLARPDGSFLILDEEELPAPLADFEDGRVERHLRQLTEAMPEVLRYLDRETYRLIADGSIR
ncbi:DUF402 domain-containing protein [Cohnella sp. REN36]|uniref:DUF402 domain-containing protein n=1 Tax=Cohnella sp. REN36 TaxID=2887347 RepID=UPI001D13CBC6|nr:DUF402 domain-containing protein [Cohnella sp. REN36]MCC3371608.1 DUF402 domain-containing protein [Cohnella sp. REN36]